jgi:hypothetical protein
MDKLKSNAIMAMEPSEGITAVEALAMWVCNGSGNYFRLPNKTEHMRRCVHNKLVNNNRSRLRNRFLLKPYPQQ